MIHEYINLYIILLLSIGTTMVILLFTKQYHAINLKY